MRRNALAAAGRTRAVASFSVLAMTDANVGLSHRRLSIIDLSAEGHQPMASADERFVIVYNGEMYNFAELREQLPGRSWRGHSDAEVVLEAIATWGIETTLRGCVGLFAFAVDDRADATPTSKRASSTPGTSMRTMPARVARRTVGHWSRL
jgi:asparagine synthase (glutamine-hydrolysing)